MRLCMCEAQKKYGKEILRIKKAWMVKIRRYSGMQTGMTANKFYERERVDFSHVQR